MAILNHALPIQNFGGERKPGALSMCGNYRILPSLDISQEGRREKRNLRIPLAQKMQKNGESNYALAKQLGVSQTTIATGSGETKPVSSLLILEQHYGEVQDLTAE